MEIEPRKSLFQTLFYPFSHRAFCDNCQKAHKLNRKWTAQSSKVASFQNLSTARHQLDQHQSFHTLWSSKCTLCQKEIWNLNVTVSYPEEPVYLGTLSDRLSLCWDVWHGTFRVSTNAGNYPLFTDTPFLILPFGEHKSFSWNHWWLLVVSALGFGVRVDHLTCALFRFISECDTCRPHVRKYVSQVSYPHNFSSSIC